MSRKVKQGLFLLLCVFLITTGAVVVFNYSALRNYGSPDSIEARLAAAAVSGDYVMTSASFDESVRQEWLIDLKPSGGDTIVFGSSRIMPANRWSLSCAGFFNHSVSGASIGDHIGLFEIMRSKEKLPAHLIISLDPWVFANSAPTNQWPLLEEPYRSFLRSARHSNEFISLDMGVWAKRLLSMDFAVLNFKAMLREADEVGSQLLQVVANDKQDGLIYRPDGSWRHSIPLPSDERLAGLTRVTDLPRMELFGQFVIKGQEDLALLLEATRLSNVKTSILLLPYHPIVYQALQTTGDVEYLKRFETLARSITSDFGVGVYGDHDPSVAGCNAEEFYDMHHPKESCVTKLIASIPAYCLP